MTKRGMLLLAAALFAIAAGQEQPARGTKYDLTAAAAKIEARTQAWQAAINRHDLEGTLAFYTERPLRRAQGRAPVSGRENIQRHWRRNFARDDFSIRLETEKIVFPGEGKTAYEYGSFTRSASSAQRSAKLECGRYILVWKRHEDTYFLEAEFPFSQACDAAAKPFR